MDSPLPTPIIGYWSTTEYASFAQSNLETIAGKFCCNQSTDFYQGMAKGMNTVFAVLKQYVAEPESRTGQSRFLFHSKKLLYEDDTEKGKLKTFKYWSAMLCAYVCRRLTIGLIPKTVSSSYDQKVSDSFINTSVDDFTRIPEESLTDMMFAFQGDQSDEFYEGLLRAYVVSFTQAETEDLPDVLTDSLQDHCIFLSNEVKKRREKQKFATGESPSA